MKRLAWLLILATTAGCGGRTIGQSSGSAVPAAAMKPVTLELKSFDELQTLIAAP